MTRLPDLLAFLPVVLMMRQTYFILVVSYSASRITFSHPTYLHQFDLPSRRERRFPFRGLQAAMRMRLGLRISFSSLSHKEMLLPHVGRLVSTELPVTLLNDAPLILLE